MVGKMPEFKDMLKYFRIKEGLSQSELAEKLGMSASRISMYEVGKREPDFESEEKIADFFNTDLNTLRGRDVETNSNKISDPDIRRIQRAREKMSEQEKSKMMKILEASFDDYFGDDFIDEDND
ncbi:XRE family transcriptional regulator [Hominisplanchenecus murintestinalis]|jgi:transcriptional regulator with XRE-family HTH domain|uniref:XRE family transcriptional regulator n=1 Tax=Hominisplanchenecus murintestinalis TaxID=2941517 RepID=A0AC61QZJ1_9FIRM|nr:XRE family transcriptional regulator [Lachnospiraceae bacterium]NBI76661.1 XRE family transcriptional regulator [Lachnospiraceae bacterium]RKJ78333.1 XRE family transcriptional regulator [Anaerotruncus sp. 1XD22-93]TGX98757.1 XRE family transcriptional regulator [Hominisplanchenecus murintestinalis]